MKFFADGERDRVGPRARDWGFVSDFAENKDASRSVGKFMLPSKGEMLVNRYI